jgi:hypothetical protein
MAAMIYGLHVEDTGTGYWLGWRAVYDAAGCMDFEPLWAPIMRVVTPQKATRTPETPTGAIFGLDTPE